MEISILVDTLVDSKVLPLGYHCPLDEHLKEHKECDSPTAVSYPKPGISAKELVLILIMPHVLPLPNHAIYVISCSKTNRKNLHVQLKMPSLGQHNMKKLT